jgi:type I restriction enzyme, S subunit
MSDWIETPLEQLADISSGGTPSRAIDDFWGGDIPWATPSDITRCKTNYLHDTREFITQKGLLLSSAKLLPTGTLLFTSRATIGEIKISIKQVSTNQGFKNFVPKECIDTNFLFYQIVNLKNEFVKYAAGSTFLEINRKDTGRVLILHPADKNEQHKIGQILQMIDRTITHTEALIEKYQQIKAGLMHDLFTRGIGADGKLRPTRDKAPELYQESSIGWIPKEWQLELLDKLAQRGSGHTPNKNIGGYWNGGVKWVSLADSRKLDKLYISDTDLEISELGIQNSSANIHPSGTVIMTRDAGVGKSAIMSEPMAVSQHFMVWRCAEKMNNYFLYYWLQYKKRMFENVAMGSTIVTIGLPYFKRLKIAAPISIGEQTIISEKLRSTDTHIFSLKSELEKLKYKKSGLMHDLLTGTVQVNIDPV